MTQQNIILANFFERSRTESRLDYLERILNEARVTSLEKDVPITVRGYFFDSDIKNLQRLYHGVVFTDRKKICEGLYMTSFTVAANLPHR